MKNVVLILIIFSVLAGCRSSKKYLEKGDFHKAVDKAVEKLRKKRDSEKDIIALQEAYPKANQKDIDKINYLHSEGKPDRWEEVLKHYQRLKNRHTNVREIMPLKLNGKSITLPYQNYDNEIINAKSKAADYFYAHGNKLMKTNNRFSHRQAYYDFIKAKKYNPSFIGIDKKINDARESGTTFVKVTFKDQTGYKLSKNFVDELFTFGSDRLDEEWINYTINPYKDEYDYHYTIFVKLKYIEVSPEHVKESEFTEKRKIQDGWEYELDGRGNVKKDSLGNDVKRPKYKTIRCRVLESIQRKSALLNGTIQFYDNMTDRKIKEKPITAESIFENIYYIANGNIEALSEEMRKRLGGRPVPFPKNIDLIYDAIPQFRAVIRSSIRRESSFIK